MSEHAQERAEREAHERRARRRPQDEPARPHEQYDTPSHAGNANVNHGLDALGGQGPAESGSDELALRRMFQRAVEDVEPQPDALDCLRQAVPARRARKRQAAVGMAAAALFLSTAVPALVHVSDTVGSDVDPAIAGSTSQTHGDDDRGESPGGGPDASGGVSGSTGSEDGGGTPDAHRGATKDAVPGVVVPGGPTGPSASAVGAPACTAAQLGAATASVGAPDPRGAVYGVFRVANVSSGSCAVGGPGEVSALARGATDAGRISVVAHTEGDPATALPAPSAAAAPGLVLGPGSAYEVRFAWVPSAACPTAGAPTGGAQTGGPGGPSPDPSPSQDAGGTNGGAAAGADGGPTTQLMTEGGTADGSVVVSHTAEAGPGSPTASATVPDACAGTVYRTGVLAVS
ncbi:hypothetical protein [Streptomyces sp. NPDC046985]|uniref:hypothetical protein n=1 Tax=Streptomyces sp. NPDC046985 TaxID=3155377 RepID=UPI0033D67845